MMNRGVMQRQMFAKGGAAFPDMNNDGSITQADILMGRGVPMQQGGNPQMALNDYLGDQTSALAAEAARLGISEEQLLALLNQQAQPEPPVGMAMGGDPAMAQGVASMMPTEMAAAPGMAGAMAAQSDMPSEAVSQAAGAVDPAVLEQMLGTVDENIQNLDGAEDFETVMNSMRGDDASIEERYAELADVVGQEDAAQTPESVLALVQPVMMLNAVDQGIGGLAQEEMTAPVEGAMAEGIMSTVAPPPEPAMMAAPMPPAGMGGPPPVNFKDGGLVRRGDNQPVLMMQEGGDPIAQAGRLGELYQQKMPLYKSILGDPTESLQKQKELTQSQMLFDIANTALAFAAPMEGERRGMSAAERLAMAARTTKLPQTIGARAQAQLDAEKAVTAQEQQMKLSALGAAETGLAAEAKAAADLKKQELIGNQEIAQLNMKDRLDTARQTIIEKLKQAGASQLEAERQAGRIALEEAEQDNRVIIENLRQAGDEKSKVLANQLDAKNIILRGNIELGKMEVANEYDIAKLDKAHEQATELQNSRLTVQQELAANSNAIKQSQLELNALNSALNQARADKNLALAQQTEARIKALDEEKLALDTRRVDLEAAAQNLNQFGTSVDGRIMNIITGKGVFQPDETASMLASRYARGETTSDEDITLNQAIEYFVAPKPVWDAENRRYTLSEGNKLAQEWRDAINERKGREGKTVPTLGGAVTTTQTSVTAPEGGPTIANLGSSVIDSLSSTAGDLPKLDATGQPIDIKDTTYKSIIDGLDPTLATGAPTAFKQALNRTAETLLPVFGQPFPEESRAVTLLDNLNTTTTVVMMQAIPGKEGEQLRQELKDVLPTAGAWTRGDETSYNKIRNTIAYLNQNINVLQKGAATASDVGKIERDIAALVSIRDTYAQLGAGYEAQGVGTSGSGDRPPLSSFFGGK